MGGAVGGGAAPTSSGQMGGGGGFFAAGPAQGGSLGLGGLPMAGSTPTPVTQTAAPTPAPEPTGLQFGTAGVGTGPVEQQTPPTLQAAPQQAMPQQMYRPQMQQQIPQYQGLQQLLSRMLSGYQQPQRALSPPQYQNRALGYRPNMALAQQNLGRTATSQAEAQAAAAKKALEDQQTTADDEGFLRWQRQQYEASKNANYGGG